MKNNLLPGIIGLMILFTQCNFPQGKNSPSGNAGNDSTHIVKQFYPNKKLKAEISVKDTVRHGLSKNYSRSGILVSEIMYKNGKRDGKAVNYYPEGGIQSEIIYKDNTKVGESKWYYPSGKIFRITPYKDGEPDGVQKMYFENGTLKAEIPLSKGKVCPGLKEYLENGKPRIVPEIILQPIDHVAMKSEFILNMQLSNQTRTVKFYLGYDKNSPCLSGYETPVSTKGGIGTYEIAVLRGQTRMEVLDIIAVEKTSYGNDRVLHKSYNLAVKNR